MSWWRAPEPAGPGFLNLRVSDAWLVAGLLEILAQARLSVAAHLAIPSGSRSRWSPPTPPAR